VVGAETSGSVAPVFGRAITARLGEAGVGRDPVGTLVGDCRLDLRRTEVAGSHEGP
jgi:hypothetical protein